MRIDLPLCDFINCRKRFDGNCKDGNEYNRCQYHRLKEQEPCEDAISRQAVEKITWEEPSYTDALNVLTEVRDKVRALPPVNPQPKTGHWIWEIDETPSSYTSPYELNYAGWVCSCCHEFPDDVCDWDNPDEKPTYKYCPNCGAKMESEDKE